MSHIANCNASSVTEVNPTRRLTYIAACSGSLRRVFGKHFHRSVVHLRLTEAAEKELVAGLFVDICKEGPISLAVIKALPFVK